MKFVHLECLRTEGKPIPQDAARGEELCLRVKRPADRGGGFYLRDVTEPVLFATRGSLRTLAPGMT